VARRPGPSLRVLLFGCGAGAVLGQTASFLVGSESNVRFRNTDNQKGLLVISIQKNFLEGYTIFDGKQLSVMGAKGH